MAGLLEAMERITRTMTRCRIYESLYSPATTSEDAVKVLRAGIVGIYTAILRTLTLSYDLYSKSTAARALHALFTPGQATSLGTRLATLESELSLEVEMCENMRKASVDCRVEQSQRQLRELLALLKDQLSSIDNTTSKILRTMEQDQQLAILQWASPLSYSLYHEEIRDARAENTCDWLLEGEKHKQWIESKHSSVLWISGFPGSGKTFLASKAIDNVKELLAQRVTSNARHQWVEGFAFFYCSRHEEARNTPLAVLRSLVRQLSTAGSYADRVHENLVQCYEKSRQSGSGLTLKVCEDLLQSFVRSYSNTTILLDALDECNERSRSQLMDTLEHLVSDPGTRVKLLVSSRPDADIRERFRNKPFIEIRATDNHDDIAVFVNQEIVKHPRWAWMEQGLKSEVIETLLRKSQGMFQWAYLQIRQLLEECRTPVAIRDRLGHLPKDLKVAYDEIYAKIQGRHSYERQLAQRAFEWVLVSLVPIPTEQLLVAVSQDPDSGEFINSIQVDEDLLLELCCNLLVIDSQFHVWRFSHLSVAEYLETHYISVDRGDLMIAKVSLAWLLSNQGDYEDYVHWNEFGPLGNYFLLFFTRHIGDHEDQSSDPTLLALLLKFVDSCNQASPALKEWLQVANKVGVDEKPVLAGLDDDDDPIFFASALGLTCVLNFWAEHGHICPAGLTRSESTSGASSERPMVSLSHTSIYGLTPLALAAINGRVNTCRTLVSMGADPDQIMNSNWAPGGNALGWASRGDRHEEITELIRLGADPNLIIPGDLPTALAVAVNVGAFRSVQALISAGALISIRQLPGAYRNLLVDSINIWDSSGSFRLFLTLLETETGTSCGADLPLISAVRTGRSKIVALMIEQGADVNLSMEGEPVGSALGVAAVDNSCDHLIPLLLECGADVNMKIETGSYGSALAAAAAYGGTYSAEVLLESGANVNMVLEAGCFGSATVAAAASINTYDMLPLLLGKGADVDMDLRAGLYGSALAAACACGRENNARILLDHGAEVNRTLSIGNYGNALVAASSVGAIGVMAMLLDRGADINMVLDYGNYGSALVAASTTGNSAAVQLLLLSGAEPNLALRTGDWGSALAAASVRADFESIDLLFEGGADVNAALTTGRYGSALAAAATVENVWKEDDREIVVYQLLKRGADVNAPLSFGYYGNALAAAAAHRNMPAVRLLLSAGADVAQQVTYGFENPLVAAIRGVELRKDPEYAMFAILRWLMLMGADPSSVSPKSQLSAIQVVDEMKEGNLWSSGDANRAMVLFKTTKPHLTSPFATPLYAGSEHISETASQGSDESETGSGGVDEGDIVHPGSRRYSQSETYLHNANSRAETAIPRFDFMSESTSFAITEHAQLQYDGLPSTDASSEDVSFSSSASPSMIGEHLDIESRSWGSASTGSHSDIGSNRQSEESDLVASEDDYSSSGSSLLSRQRKFPLQPHHFGIMMR